MLCDIQIEEIAEMMVHIYNCNKHTCEKYVGITRLLFFCTGHKPTAYPMYRNFKTQLREILGSLSDKILLNLLVM